MQFVRRPSQVAGNASMKSVELRATRYQDDIGPVGRLARLLNVAPDAPVELDPLALECSKLLRRRSFSPRRSERRVPTDRGIEFLAETLELIEEREVRLRIRRQDLFEQRDRARVTDDVERFVDPLGARV